MVRRRFVVRRVRRRFVVKICGQTGLELCSKGESTTTFLQRLTGDNAPDGTKMATVFDNIVTKENDHTNLLRSIMERHPKASATILSCLLTPQEISETEAASLRISTQHASVGADGREIPDILVEGPDFHCVIEAKVDPLLGLTDGQMKGYAGCFTQPGNSHLCFLVPDRWKHSQSLNEVRTALPANVALHVCDWRKLINNFEGFSVHISDEVIDEAIRFWKWSFEIDHMTLQERDSLYPWSSEKYSAIRKLEKAVSRAKALFDARGNLKMKLETSDTYSYGFYLKQGQSYLLWVGIWTEAPAPLSLGFHANKGEWRRPKDVPAPSATADGYYLWPLELETFDDSEKIYSQVKSFLEVHYPDLNKDV